MPPPSILNGPAPSNIPALFRPGCSQNSLASGTMVTVVISLRFRAVDHGAASA